MGMALTASTILPFAYLGVATINKWTKTRQVYVHAMESADSGAKERRPRGPGCQIGADQRGRAAS